MSRTRTSPTRAKLGEDPTQSPPAKPDHGENSASGIIEAPLSRPDPKPMKAHDFADGGGSGGAEQYSRERTKP